MLKDIVKPEWKTITFYHLHFTEINGAQYCFSCDENGNVDVASMSDVGKKNYDYCMNNPEKFVLRNDLRAFRTNYVLPPHGTCECGETVTLEDQYHGACQCQKCGRWYNMYGQEVILKENPSDDCEDENDHYETCYDDDIVFYLD